MNETSAHEQTQQSEGQKTTNGHKRAANSSVELRREHDTKQLDEAIEQYSTAIAQLLQACGSSRDFGIDQMREFGRLFRHRRRLIAKLERLQHPASSDNKTPLENLERNQQTAPALRSDHSNLSVLTDGVEPAERRQLSD